MLFAFVTKLLNVPASEDAQISKSWAYETLNFWKVENIAIICVVALTSPEYTGNKYLLLYSCV